jgi:hypothetical protein
VAAVSTHTFDTFVDDDDATVTFCYSPGRPGRNYMPNGDPGYPDEPAEIELISVIINGEEAVLTEAQAESLDQRLYEYILAEQAAEESAYWDSVAERRKEDSEL